MYIAVYNSSISLVMQSIILVFGLSMLGIKTKEAFQKYAIIMSSLLGLFILIVWMIEGNQVFTKSLYESGSLLYLYTYVRISTILFVIFFCAINDITRIMIGFLSVAGLFIMFVPNELFSAYLGSGFRTLIAPQILIISVAMFAVNKKSIFYSKQTVLLAYVISFLFTNIGLLYLNYYIQSNDYYYLSQFFLPDLFDANILDQSFFMYIYSAVIVVQGIMVYSYMSLADERKWYVRAPLSIIHVILFAGIFLTYTSLRIVKPPMESNDVDYFQLQPYAYLDEHTGVVYLVRDNDIDYLYIYTDPGITITYFEKIQDGENPTLEDLDQTSPTLYIYQINFTEEVVYWLRITSDYSFRDFDAIRISEQTIDHFSYADTLLNGGE